MKIIADTHVHLYDCFDWALAMDAADEKLRFVGKESVLVLCLTEGRNEHAFETLRSRPETVMSLEWNVRPTAESGALMISRRDRSQGLYVLRGFQVISCEKVEVLALVADERPADGVTVRKTVGAIRASGGCPVLPWAAGKWMGRRGRTVDEALRSAEPGEVAVGDTPLRPRSWPEPSPMRTARRRGLARLCGSDPFPYPGDVRTIGAYATVLEGAFDPNRPVTSMRLLLANPAAVAGVVGERGGWMSFMDRQIRLKFVAGRRSAAGAGQQEIR